MICQLTEWKEVIVKMSNQRALVSTALLTAIGEDSKKDYLNLMYPFIYNILCLGYEVGDIIDKTYVQSQLKEKFSFNNFPISVLNSIFDRMSKEKILSRHDKDYKLCKDVKEYSEDFKSRIDISKREINDVLNGIVKYINEEKSNKSISLIEAEEYLSTFVETYGYNAYNNIYFACDEIDRKKDTINYLIGEFIRIEFENKTIIFDYVLKIIEGYMLANVIYLQIDNNSKPSLRGVTCYLDAPLILKICGFKTNEENKCGFELHSMLKKYGATLKCFSHTYDEVMSILVNYKNNINKNRLSTLEFFDEKKYTPELMDIVIASLDNKFNELGILIDNKPLLETSNEKYNIDCKGLETRLKEYKEKNNSYYTDRSINNDVESIRSIAILRKGEMSSKFEKCSYIFVTPFYYLVKASDEITGSYGKNKIGLAINDLDLTTILWFKDLNKNSDLPKMRLIENARAATAPSENLMKKTVVVYEQLIAKNLIPDLNGVSDVISSICIDKYGYNDVVKNDPDSVTEKSLSDFLNNIIDRNKSLENTAERAMKVVEITKREKEDVIKRFYDDIEKGSQKVYNISKNIVSGIVFIIYFMVNTFLIWCYLSNSDLSVITISSIFVLIMDIYGIVSMVKPNVFIKKKIILYAKNRARDYRQKETKKINEKFDVNRDS